jgi:hypothetical protein
MQHFAALTGVRADETFAAAIEGVGKLIIGLSLEKGATAKAEVRKLLPTLSQDGPTNPIQLLRLIAACHKEPDDGLFVLAEVSAHASIV